MHCNSKTMNYERFTPSVEDNFPIIPKKFMNKYLCTKQ